MKRFELVLLLLLGVLLASCSASGPRFAGLETPPAGQALLYVYRPSAFCGSAIDFSLLVDDRYILPLERGSFTYLPVRQGEHEVKFLFPRPKGGFHIPDVSVLVPAQLGAVNFARLTLECQTKFLLPVKFVGHLELVQQNQALQELATLNLHRFEPK